MTNKLKQISPALFYLLTLKHQPCDKIISYNIVFFATEDKRILVSIAFDYADKDYNVIIFGRDEIRQYRAFDVRVSYPSLIEAINAAQEAIWDIPEDKFCFPQKDVDEKIFDIFIPVVPEDQLHDFFKSLSSPLHSPAKEAIREIAYIFKDKDGNFIQQFQTTGFNARLFELYMFAFLHEEHFFVDNSSKYPDFVFSKGKNCYALECTTVNPGKCDIDTLPQKPVEIEKLIKDYFPIKFGSALYSKLTHQSNKKHYWELPNVVGKPLIIAIEDFHLEDSMCYSSSGLERYLYGYEYIPIRHEDGSIDQIPQKIESFDWKEKHIDKPFFELENCQYVSAVLFSNSATIAKFNRIGRSAGLGVKKLEVTRTGLWYNPNPTSLMPIPFTIEVDENYFEAWSDGARMYHNPNALYPVNKDDFIGIAHFELDKNNRLLSYVPRCFPISSYTFVREIKSKENLEA
ncbi:hypothetical protein [Victivallis vadensis]|uniref:hypothetical protein n=1 Tax=Victivallis vadensis TaxID=172901 RepID=UPI0023F310F4|nr:hypothetical protein [Victivallis vadensis]